jgi:hypothetical protein
MAISAVPILPVKSISGNQWLAQRIIEEASQTFQQGTPVMLTTADGGIKAWDGTAGAGHLIAGISYEAAHNFASTGLGAPLPNQPVVGVGASVTFGSVQNQTSAVNIPMGAPFTDGRVGFFPGAADTIFSATFGNNGNPTTPANTDVGIQYGLTIDSNSRFWYVDKSKTGASAVVLVVGLDPRYTPASGTNVLFQFIAADVSLLGV